MKKIRIRSISKIKKKKERKKEGERENKK